MIDLKAFKDLQYKIDVFKPRTIGYTTSPESFELKTLYFYGCIPCKVRLFAVESLLAGRDMCGEPIHFDDSITLDQCSRIASLLRGVIPKYTKEKILCYINF